MTVKEKSTMKLRKIVTVLSAGALVFGLAACSSDGDNGGSGDYVTTYGTEPQNPLLPADTNEVGGGNIIDLVFSGLVYYDEEGEVHNDVAESIESDDSQHYTVKIKDGETFSDGTPVTAESFVKAWNYAVENSQKSAYFFEPILGFEEGASSMEGLKVQDDHTFTIELTQPESDFATRLGYSAFYPLPEVAYDDMQAFGENPVGNGPYKLESWNHNQDATVVPDENYDGDRKAQNDGVQFVFYTNPDAAYADLLSGNLDVLDTVPDSAFSSYEQELGDRSVNKPVAMFQSFTINSNEEHFSGEEGKLRREALSMAIDREEITDTIFQGTRTPATDFTSPVIPGHSDSLEGKEVLEFNPEKAKELWKKADEISPYSGEFTIGYNSDGGHQAWVDAVTNQLRNNLGIDANGAPTPDFKTLRDDIENRTIKGGFRTGWQADYPSLGNFLEPLYATNGGSNDGDYANKAFDDKLRQAAGATDTESANKSYNEAQEILLQDLPAIPLWYANTVGGYSENVDNVVFSWKSVPLYYQITKK